MDFIHTHLLTLILFIPLVGAGLIALLPREQGKLIKWAALLISLLPLALSIVMVVNFRPEAPGFQFPDQALWFPQIGSSYHVGVDGISVAMVLLTTLLTPLALLISFSIEEDVRAFFALFLMLEGGMLGVFVSLDLILFFLFWEIGLVPMYFLINRWGSKKGEREIWAGIKVPSRTYAAFKFMIYTMVGSLGLLLAIQVIGVVAGAAQNEPAMFDIVRLYEFWPNFTGTLFGLPISTIKTIGFWLFAIAFSVKVPVWPFHTWLPDAHTEAPTAGSMILAGVLLKLGAYGFLRLVLPLFPDQAAAAAGVFAVLGLAAAVVGGLAALGQDDFKRLVAYSSVGHMGFVVLGIAVAAKAMGGGVDAADAVIATNGAVLQMFNHGLSAAAMFALVGMVYERAHTRDLKAFGGLGVVVPAYGGVLLFCTLASLGLPGLNGFVSEFMVFRGAWPVFTLVTALATLGLIFTAAYLLWTIQKVLLGPLNETWRDMKEINAREAVAIVPLMALMLLIGVWPSWLINIFNAAVMRLLG
ncbi:MAG: NADH-quinone oxidoreductase subunit M [Anaerolineae bacterium]|nr:NADH-quinone oxidoreductase subunit M [Anaerolineae bacterium]